MMLEYVRRYSFVFDAEPMYLMPRLRLFSCARVVAVPSVLLYVQMMLCSCLYERGMNVLVVL